MWSSRPASKLLTRREGQLAVTCSYQSTCARARSFASWSAAPLTLLANTHAQIESKSAQFEATFSAITSVCKHRNAAAADFDASSLLPFSGNSAQQIKRRPFPWHSLLLFKAHASTKLPHVRTVIVAVSTINARWKSSR